MVKPFFRASREKWLWGIKMAKMGTTGGLSIHLQKAPKLSNEWGTPHITYLLLKRSKPIVPNSARVNVNYTCLRISAKENEVG
jgi:hypothetical protein